MCSTETRARWVCGRVHTLVPARVSRHCIKDAAEIPDGMRWGCRYAFCGTVRPNQLIEGCLLCVVLCGDALQCRGVCEQGKEGVHVSRCEGKQFYWAGSMWN